MCELSNMLKRGKLSNLISYLIYAEESNGEIIESYKKQLEESHETIFSELERRYSEADRNDNSLFDLVNDFAAIHDDIYFEVGVLVGFQLYKELDEGYKKHSKSDIRTVLKKYMKCAN